jgi:hypothetical protein
MTTVASPPHAKVNGEADDLEIKGQYSKHLRDKGGLVKTIVAMANTRGGRIQVHSADDSAMQDLDGANLESIVAKHVAPPITGIVSARMEGGTIEIRIPDSTRKPHVIERQLTYKDDEGSDRCAFYQGQVWVRHSAKNDPARSEDLERMLRDRVAVFLGELQLHVLQAPGPLTGGVRAGPTATDAVQVPVEGATRRTALEFVNPGTPEANLVEKERWVKEEVERPKLRAKDIVRLVREAGFPRFTTNSNTILWKAEDAKHPSKDFGIDVCGYWHWYRSWLDRVLEICQAAGDKYR